MTTLGQQFDAIAANEPLLDADYQSEHPISEDAIDRAFSRSVVPEHCWEEDVSDFLEDDA